MQALCTMKLSSKVLTLLGRFPRPKTFKRIGTPYQLAGALQFVQHRQSFVSIQVRDSSFCIGEGKFSFGHKLVTNAALCKKGVAESRNPLILLVAGEGFEPSTFGL
jgi:hypothetical protein